MILLRLFFEFFKVGFFSVGGGLATIPFLTEMGERMCWFTSSDLADMIAVSECTPGPLGINMATYVGFRMGGVPGGIVATLGLITPAILVIFLVALFLKKFRESRAVDAVFYGLRPASAALVTAALVQVAVIALMFHEVTVPESGVVKTQLFHWPAIILAAIVFVCLQIKPLKKLHPIVFIALSAVAGIVFKL